MIQATGRTNRAASRSGSYIDRPMEQLPTTEALRGRVLAALRRCGVGIKLDESGDIAARTPITGGEIGRLVGHDAADVDDAVHRAAVAFAVWRTTPAPFRGELIRRLADTLRAHQDDLAEIVSIEAGKIRSEGLGEVQEMINVCDFASGLSRQLDGRTIASEHRGHRLMETWHPLGPCAVITPFDLPVAVWSWNTALAVICGDPVIWKPSERTPISALTCDALFAKVANEMGVPADLCQVILGGRNVGQVLVDHPGIPLVSATGSTAMGRIVAPRVAARFGRSILELGGNNAAIVTPSADLNRALPGIVSSATGTAGQRCTSLRRLIVHRSILDEMVSRLVTAYRSLSVGDPLQPGTLVGPLIDRGAYDAMVNALTAARTEGGDVIIGGDRVDNERPDGFYVHPTIVVVPSQTPVVAAETLAPILYVMPYDTFEEAIAIHNGVAQGLASSIYTTDMREAERFMSSAGSDCGIANVNLSPGRAEIGGAFGGEKETGGGREWGSDAWKAYMRRATNTINYSDE